MVYDVSDSVTLQYVSSINTVTTLEKRDYARFLRQHLDGYDEPEEHLMRAVDYAVSKYPHQGGFLLLAQRGRETVGLCVMNQTHMSGYFPENLLVFLAVHQEHRRQGLGRRLIEKSLQMAKGDVSVRIAPNNPARSLFEAYDFTKAYLELRRPG